jgi:hypothetical protein
MSTPHERLAGALTELQAQLLAPPSPEVATRHLAAMRDAASGSHDRRRSPTLRSAFALVACVTLVGVTGGLAATGALPAPVQTGVSGVAGVVGIDLPSPATRAPGHTPDDPLIPGKSDVAPGHLPDDPSTPGKSDVAPGHVNDGQTTPGATAPGRTDDTQGAHGNG